MCCSPGKRPHELLERSNGYIFLLESQEEILFSIIMAFYHHGVVDGAVFGILCVPEVDREKDT